jgi:hypothetical protein
VLVFILCSFDFSFFSAINMKMPAVFRPLAFLLMRDGCPLLLANMKMPAVFRPLAFLLMRDGCPLLLATYEGRVSFFRSLAFNLRGVRVLYCFSFTAFPLKCQRFLALIYEECVSFTALRGVRVLYCF